MAILVPSSPFLHSPIPPLNRRRRTSPITASSSPNGGTRRTLLLIGISVLPFCHFKTVVAEPLIGARRRRSGVSRYREDVPGAKQEVEKKEILFQVPSQIEQEERKVIMVQAPSQTEQEEKKDILVQVPSKPEAGKEEIGSQEEGMILAQEENQSEKIAIENGQQIPIENGPMNPFAFLLNGIGIVSSGVLGALYASSRKEKTAMESTIESIKSELTMKEADINLLKENFEATLQNEQEERRKQIRKLQEEEASLAAQLASANGTIAHLHQKLQSEEYLTKDLKGRVSELEHAVVQTEENMKMLETKLKEKMGTIDVLQDKISLLSLEINDKEKSIGNMKSLLVEKDSANKNLSSVVVQTKSDLAEANSVVEKLRVEILQCKEELNSEKSSIKSLNEKIRSLQKEKTESDMRLHDLVKLYNDLKSSSEKQRSLDSNLLSKKDSELKDLGEKLGRALSEASASQTMIAESAKERDHVTTMLQKEVDNMKKIKADLITTQEALCVSRSETGNLSAELVEAKRLYREVTARASSFQDELNESKKQLNIELDKQKSRSKALSEQLESITNVLERTKEELGVTSNDLKAAMEDREGLKKELLEIYKKVETTAQELKEEKNLVATLNGQLELLGKQMQKDHAARKALEADLDEATRALDDMSKSALLLSQQLEDAHSRTSSLESEKEMVLKTLAGQKLLSKEAQENIEDAHSLITRLGGERENLEKRSKKLEEELTAAKGEILRLRRKISASRESVVDIPQGTPVGVKKTASRRAKGGSTSEASTN